MAGARYLCDRTPVAVATANVHPGGLAEAQFRKRLLRTPAERLTEFRRVDLGQPHADFAPLHQDGHGVAVVDGDHASGEAGGAGKRWKEEREEGCSKGK